MGIQAQGTAAGQKPPATTAGQKPPQGGVAGGIVGGLPNQPPPPPQAKPADAAQEEMPADFKAFNAAAGEKDPAKRVAALEKFIADNPKSQLASIAKSEIQSATLAAFKDSRKKYLDLVKAQIDTAKSGPNAANVSSTYMRYADEMFRNGGLMEEAEDYARTGLSLMDEQKYTEAMKQSMQRAIDAYAKRAAAQTAAAPSTAPPTTTPPVGISMSRNRDGLMQVRPLPPRPPSTTPSTPPQAPKMPTDQEIRAQFRTQKASAQATLGQILIKRGKTDEGGRLLKEAYDAKLTGPTLATVARALLDLTKNSGDDKGRMEYLTVLALTGRNTPAERQDLEAAYKKTHNGSADGLEAMLDERWKKENPRFEVTPVAHKASPTSHAVLAELFSGAG